MERMWCCNNIVLLFTWTDSSYFHLNLHWNPLNSRMFSWHFVIVDNKLIVDCTRSYLTACASLLRGSPAADLASHCELHTSSVKDHFDDTDCCADATGAGDDDYDIGGSDDVGAEDLRLTSLSLKERIG